MFFHVILSEFKQVWKIDFRPDPEQIWPKIDFRLARIRCVFSWFCQSQKNEPPTKLPLRRHITENRTWKCPDSCGVNIKNNFPKVLTTGSSPTPRYRTWHVFGFSTLIFQTDFWHGYLTRILTSKSRFPVGKSKKSPKLHLGGGVADSYFQGSFRTIRQMLKQNRGHVRPF